MNDNVLKSLFLNKRIQSDKLSTKEILQEHESELTRFILRTSGFDKNIVERLHVLCSDGNVCGELELLVGELYDNLVGGGNS